MLIRAIAGAAAVFGSAELNSDGPAQMAQVKPFVASLYQRYQKGSIILENPSMIYSPALMQRMAQKRRAAVFETREATAPIARDPLCNCTRYDVTAVEVNVTPLADGRADADVSFRNFGKRERVAITLVDVGGEWRVDDIRGSNPALKKPLAPVASLAD